MTAWHVADRDRRLGPFTDEEMRAAVDRGDLPPHCKVWRDGLDGWAPIQSHFPHRRRRRFRPGAMLAAFVRGLGLAAVTLALLAALGLSVALIYFGALDLAPVRWAGRLWLASGVVLAILAVLAPVLWWRTTRRWRGVEMRGVVRILVVAISIGGACVAGLQLQQASQVDGISSAGEEMRDYRFVYEPQGQILRIDGMIGRGFAHALRRELAGRTVRRVEITSYGGLTDQALDAAKQLQALKISVAARETCASACIVVLMGGTERLADYDMVIDFHASASVVDLKGDWWTVMQRRQDKELNDYLLARGVPKAYLAEAARLGPGKLYSVPALLLIENKMLTGLLDEEDAPVTAAQARQWMVEEGFAAMEFEPMVTDISGN